MIVVQLVGLQLPLTASALLKHANLNKVAAAVVGVVVGVLDFQIQKTLANAPNVTVLELLLPRNRGHLSVFPLHVVQLIHFFRRLFLSECQLL